MPRDEAAMRRLRRPLRVWHRAWKDRWLAAGGDAERRGARIDMLLFDHGFVRYVWRNQHQIAPDIWRGGQPDPGMIRRLGGRGFRTILNLRGETQWGSYLLEREACAAAGIELVNLKLNSRVLPPLGTMRELDAIFARAATPMLIHCKSGSDRAGFVSALYLLLRAGATPEVARAQLSWRYLYLNRGGAGVLGYAIDAYAADRARSGIGFRDWLATCYDPDALMAGYKRGAVATFVCDRVLGRE